MFLPAKKTVKERIRTKLASVPAVSIRMRMSQRSGCGENDTRSVAMDIVTKSLVGEQLGRTFTQPLVRCRVISVRAAFGHIGKAFFVKNGKQLLHISAAVRFSKFRLRYIDLVSIVHRLWPSCAAISANKNAIRTSVAAQVAENLRGGRTGTGLRYGRTLPYDLPAARVLKDFASSACRRLDLSGSPMRRTRLRKPASPETGSNLGSALRKTKSGSRCS